ncbi:MAG TPA: NAD(P)/FAD-dependent oxidoreductase [Candidatus Methylomirabilis sp.]|jgi:prolycopene isomerase
MPEGRYDVIVVGGGIGGLATAALAARHGLRPLVMEQGEAPGGACATIARHGYRFDAGASLLWGFEEGGGPRRLLEEVQVPVESLPLDPGMQVALPGHRFGFYRAEERFWREIRREFPRAEADLRALYGEVQALDGALRGLDLGAGDLPPRTVWGRLQHRRGRSREEGELERRAREPLDALPAWQALPAELQRALALVLRHLGQAGTSSPLLVAATLLGLTRRGFAGLRGGAGSLVASLARAVERHGGGVRTATRATEVVVRGRRAAGVRAADGALLEARAVVAAVAPGLLAAHLLAEGGRAFPGGPPAPATAAFTLYLGVDEAILPSEMGSQVLVGLPDTLESGGIDALSVSASPAWDGSRAPRGCRALTVTAFLPLRDGGPAGGDWLQVGEGVLSALDGFLPGLRRRMDYCEIRSPVVWQEQTGRPHGAAGYAPGSLPVFLGWQGFPHRTPLGGLFVAGDWTFPGGGVAAVTEGARRTVDLLLAARK